MKNLSKLLAFFDKVSLIIIIACILTLLFAMTTSIHVKRELRTNERLNTQIAEMQFLSERFMSMKEIVEFKERKVGLTKTEGIVSTLEQILNPIGLKANAIRPLQKKSIEGYLLEDAELEIQGVDLNSIVNLLYKIENSPFPLRVKDTLIRTTFENPNRFILKITVSLISKA